MGGTMNSENHSQSPLIETFQVLVFLTQHWYVFVDEKKEKFLSPIGTKRKM
jgi:hypothetical protein